MSNIQKYKNFINEFNMATTDIDHAIVEWLDKNEDKYLKIQNFTTEHINEIIDKIMIEYQIPKYQRRYVTRSVKRQMGFNDICKVVESNDAINIPSTYNNLFYTKSGFLKMLRQVTNFYYDEFGIEFLGSGAEGNAFEIKSKDETKVLKICNSSNEAYSIEKVRKYNFPELVDYYDVREIVDKSGVYPKNYAILMESVKPLSDLEKTVWSFLRGYFFDLRSFNSSTMFSNFLVVYGDNIDYNTFKKEHTIAKLNSLYSKYRENRKLRNYGFGIHQIYWIYDNIDHDLMVSDAAYETMLKYYKTFCNLVYNAVKYKLILRDFHTDNCGKDEHGNLKFFDVLYTRKESKLKLKAIEISI